MRRLAPAARRRACGLAGLVVAASLAGPARAADADPAAARRALDFLRARDVDVSYDSLTRALGGADPAVVAALLDAGVEVGPADAARASAAVVSGLASACVREPVPSGRIGETLALLAGKGLPVGYADQLGNTILLSAAQFCPAPVADRLLALGAPVDPVNKQGFTPLKMALVSGKWDVAKVLIDHGARVTRKEQEQLFFEPPQDPDQRALLARATR